VDELLLYAYKFRSRAERVLWTLQELTLPHRVVRLNPLKGETRTAEFLKLNPAGKVPVLVHGDKVLTESLAIMEYLNDIGGKSLVPGSAWEAYRYRQVVHYGLTEIEPYLWIAEQGTRLAAFYSWPEGTVQESLARVGSSIDAIWKQLSVQAYVAGEAFSLADIYYYQLITWAQKHAVQAPPEVAAYLARLQARPAFPSEMIAR
jgi:glutathione S-transferase